MKDYMSILRKERNALLNQWINANESEKVKLLVKIMDIDEQLEAGKRPPKKNRRPA